MARNKEKKKDQKKKKHHFKINVQKITAIILLIAMIGMFISSIIFI